MAGSESFLLLLDDLEDLDKLSDTEAGQLFKAIVEYVRFGVLPDHLADRADCMFGYIRRRLDKNREKYEETCRKRAEAGRKGGKQKQANLANASKSKQTLANLADNVSDIKNNTVSDNDSDNDSDNVPQKQLLPDERTQRIRFLQTMIRLYANGSLEDKPLMEEYRRELAELKGASP